MRKALAPVLLALAVAPLAAQMPDSYREVQVRQLEMQRNLLIAMADSMPVDLYTDKATPAQRSFAEQLAHAAGAVPGIAARFALGTQANLRPDMEAISSSKDAMKSFINEVYDWSVEQLRAQSASSREESVTMFGLNLPRWQVWDEINIHTLWTAGQVVANFRKHGMAPPGFGFF